MEGPPSCRTQVLLVDDEPDLARLVAFNLSEAGFEVTTSGSAEDAFSVAKRARPSLAIVDVMLPAASGIDLLRRIRADGDLAEVPVLLLTARGDEEDRVLGFESGADDYVVKPFSVAELVLRVRALARRARERTDARAAPDDAAPAAHLRWRKLTIDLRAHRVYVSGAEVLLRPLEFKLITTLIENPERTYSRAELLSEVWGVSSEIGSRTVDTHVRRLREKLGAAADAVETVHGFGYRLRRVT